MMMMIIIEVLHPIIKKMRASLILMLNFMKSTTVTIFIILINAIITYVISLYNSFSFSEEEIQKVIDCHKILVGAGFLMI